MKKIFLLTPGLLLVVLAFSQTKVAAYSVGKPWTAHYESFSFWAVDGKRTTIDYEYGKDLKHVQLVYLAKDTINGQSCFKVKFSNGYVLYVVPVKQQLKVFDADGKYNKLFSWEYEGPINGIGTYCDVCAEDDEDAMNLIESCYMK